MKKLILTGMALALSLGASLTASAAGDAAKGKTLYAVCASCHGADGAGNQAMNAPRLAGQQVWYMERQLKNFKEGIRGADPKDATGMTMRPMAMTLKDDAAIADVAAYAATLTGAPAKPTVTGDAAKGKTLYAVCASCHGADGAGNQAMNAPALKGQQDWYIITQLKHFKDGVRGANPKDAIGMTMAPMAKTLADDQALKDVAAYINTLK